MVMSKFWRLIKLMTLSCVLEILDAEIRMIFGRVTLGSLEVCGQETCVAAKSLCTTIVEHRYIQQLIRWYKWWLSAMIHRNEETGWSSNRVSSGEESPHPAEKALKTWLFKGIKPNWEKDEWLKSGDCVKKNVVIKKNFKFFHLCYTLQKKI